MSTHIFVRSCYSFLNSTIRIDALVHKAKKEGYRAVALTDHNVLYGAASFLQACQKENIHYMETRYQKSMHQLYYLVFES